MSHSPLATIIVGFGAIAARLTDDPAMGRAFACATHAQAIGQHPEFHLLGVVDTSQEALDLAQRRWGVPHVAETIEELREVCDPEVAVLTIPTQLRPAVIDALPSLRAVIAEKPIGDKAASFLACCEQRGILVQVNYWRRADATLRELANGGLRRRIGVVQAAFATYGNGLQNNGGHLVDQIRLLLGEVESVQALGLGTELADAPIPGDRQISFALHLEGGHIVYVNSIEYSNYREIGLDIWGETGRIEVLQEGLAIYQTPTGPNRGLDGARELVSEQRESVPAGASRALWGLYDNLAKTISGRAQLWSPGDSALRTEMVLGAVIASAASDGARQHLTHTA